MASTIDKILDRLPMVTDACDVDLLRFFARHPRCLITSEDLAAYVGYEIQQIARSLEMLIGAGVLSRSQNRTHAARMYLLNSGTPSGGWLPTLLQLVASREGRAAVLSRLKTRRPERRLDARARRGRRLVARVVEAQHA
jgi:hypothetical protein